MSNSQVAVAVLCGWEGNRRSDVTLAMRHRLCGISTYGLNGLKLGTHYPCPRAVFTARKQGCQKMTPVFTGRVVYSTGDQHGREHRCHFWHPCSRAVSTARELRALFWTLVLLLVCTELKGGRWVPRLDFCKQYVILHLYLLKQCDRTFMEYSVCLNWVA